MTMFDFTLDATIVVNKTMIYLEGQFSPISGENFSLTSYEDDSIGPSMLL